MEGQLKHRKVSQYLFDKEHRYFVPDSRTIGSSKIHMKSRMNDTGSGTRSTNEMHVIELGVVLGYFIYIIECQLL